MENGSMNKGIYIIATVVIGILAWMSWMTYTGQLAYYL